MNSALVEQLEKRGIVNPLRTVSVIDRMIDSLQLDLKGLTVLTEAASGAYAWTPLIAARAGAAHVIAMARDSAWGPVKPRAGFAPWTDDYSTILPLLKAGR